MHHITNTMCSIQHDIMHNMIPCITTSHAWHDAYHVQHDTMHNMTHDMVRHRIRGDEAQTGVHRIQKCTKVVLVSDKLDTFELIWPQTMSKMPKWALLGVMFLEIFIGYEYSEIQKPQQGRHLHFWCGRLKTPDSWHEETQSLPLTEVRILTAGD